MRNFVIKMFLQSVLQRQKSTVIKVEGWVYFYPAALIKGSEENGVSQFPFVLSKLLQFSLEGVERKEDKIAMSFC